MIRVNTRHDDVDTINPALRAGCDTMQNFPFFPRHFPSFLTFLSLGWFLFQAQIFDDMILILMIRYDILDFPFLAFPYHLLLLNFSFTTSNFSKLSSPPSGVFLLLAAAVIYIYVVAFFPSFSSLFHYSHHLVSMPDRLRDQIYNEWSLYIKFLYTNTLNEFFLFLLLFLPSFWLFCFCFPGYFLKPMMMMRFFTLWYYINLMMHAWYKHRNIRRSCFTFLPCFSAFFPLFVCCTCPCLFLFPYF